MFIIAWYANVPGPLKQTVVSERARGHFARQGLGMLRNGPVLARPGHHLDPPLLDRILRPIHHLYVEL
jgi:hypothetical protein